MNKRAKQIEMTFYNHKIKNMQTILWYGQALSVRLLMFLSAISAVSVPMSVCLLISHKKISRGVIKVLDV